MRVSSFWAKASALSFALVGHGALALFLVPQTGVELEGQSGAAVARIGSVFADLTAGSLPSSAPQQAIEAERVTEAVEASPLEPVMAAPLVTSMPVTAQAVAKMDNVEAKPLTSVEQERSVLRPEPRQEEKLIEEEQTKTPQPTRQASAGNSDRSARAGDARGVSSAKAATQGASGALEEAGNAAASNYPGEVMRVLSRGPRPSVSVRASAFVSFRIAGSGALEQVGISRSSGSASLDRAALQMVERAAPFPAPPTGAQRSFSVEIKGR
ncbi:TonB family protein [Celeribacter litoreus]|uniref:TonB family protein n=1 Tax=Celeribacter litoreus TaxID=2876714 RepID=UPI001CCDB6B5|nr:TonB family protein [Celeribacter litoreus]MCA0043962.1 TonB family protein [Celeribacter litoreus]